MDYNDLLQMSSTGLRDGLTGVVTRTVFLSRMQKLLESGEYGSCTTLCFVDLDDLKTLNDTHGHQAVSYTHLDVYKRQLWHRGCESMTGNRLIAYFFVYREEGDYEKNTIRMEICTSCLLYTSMLGGYAGIGLTFLCIQPLIQGMFEATVKLQLVITWQSVLVSVLFSSIVLLISAWLPARRASRITPIDALRQNQDVSIRAKDVRGTRWIRRFFGFSAELGAKNMKRSRHRYYATLFSLIISMVLFMTAYSFSTFIAQAFSMAQGEIPADVTGGMSGYKQQEKETIRKQLSQLSYGDAFLYMESVTLQDHSDAAYSKQLQQRLDYGQRLSLQVIALDGESFSRYAKQANASIEDATGEAVQAILLNKLTYKKENTYTDYRLLKDAQKGMTLQEMCIRDRPYETVVLVENREAAAHKYSNCIVERATLDDIMLLYVKGEQI